MCAEAAMPNTDGVLRAERGRDQGVMNAVDGEGADTEPVDIVALPQPQPANPGDVTEVAVAVRQQAAVMRGDLLHADACERGGRGSERNRADNVGTAGLMAVGQRGPLHIVERDVAHRTSAGEH